MTTPTLSDATAPFMAELLRLDDVATAAGAQPDPAEALRLMYNLRRLIKELQVIERELELAAARRLPRRRGERFHVAGLGEFRARPERREVRWDHRRIARTATGRLIEAGAGSTPELLADELLELAGVSYWRTGKLADVVGLNVDEGDDPMRTYVEGPLRVEAVR